MKRTILLIAIALLVSTTAAIEGYDGPEDQPHIMGSGSSSSASASTAAGPNGTEWTAKLSMAGSQCLSNSSTGVTNSSFGTENDTYSVSFQGTVETSDPCHTLDHEVIETSNGHYMMNITSNPSNGTCTQCVGSISYEASFEADEAFDIEILHDGDKVEGFTHPERDDNEPKDDKSSGFMASIVNFLKNLF